MTTGRIDPNQTDQNTDFRNGALKKVNFVYYCF